MFLFIFSDLGLHGCVPAFASCTARASLVAEYGGLELLAVVAHIAPVVSFYVFHFFAVVGLHCCTQAFSICREWGLLTSCGGQLLTAVASLLWRMGSRHTGFSS